MDTNTIDSKIAVMQAFAAGRAIQFRRITPLLAETWKDVADPKWNWSDCVYRVKPIPRRCYVGFTRTSMVDKHETPVIVLSEAKYLARIELYKGSKEYTFVKMSEESES